jgi:hypothetical protein
MTKIKLVQLLRNGYISSLPADSGSEKSSQSTNAAFLALANYVRVSHHNAASACVSACLKSQH